jgi:hypothetical protein
LLDLVARWRLVQSFKNKGRGSVVIEGERNERHPEEKLSRKEAENAKRKIDNRLSFSLLHCKIFPSRLSPFPLSLSPTRRQKFRRLSTPNKVTWIKLFFFESSIDVCFGSLGLSFFFSLAKGGGVYGGRILAGLFFFVDAGKEN